MIRREKNKLILFYIPKRERTYIIITSHVDWNGWVFKDLATALPVSKTSKQACIDFAM